MQTKHLTQVALMVAIIIVLGLFPAIPLGFIPAPIVIQNLGILLAGLLLGAKRGTLTVGIFLALVALGFPFLPGGRGGIAMFVGPTMGYLMAYFWTPMLIAGLVKLTKAKGNWWKSLIIVVLIGVGFIDTMGAFGLAFQNHIAISKALGLGLIFIPGDLIKSVLAVVLAHSLQRHPQVNTLLQ